MKYRNKSIMQVNIKKDTYSIRLTEHSQLRLKQRKIDEGLLVSAILAIGFDKLISYKNKEVDIMVTDKENNFSIIFCVKINTIQIITVINKADCFMKEHTVKLN